MKGYKGNFNTGQDDEFDGGKSESKPPKNPHAQALGRLGGKAGRGPSKARTTEQARAAVAVRWNKVKQQKQLNESTL